MKDDYVGVGIISSRLKYEIADMLPGFPRERADLADKITRRVMSEFDVFDRPGSPSREQVEYATAIMMALPVDETIVLSNGMKIVCDGTNPDDRPRLLVQYPTTAVGPNAAEELLADTGFGESTKPWWKLW